MADPLVEAVPDVERLRALTAAVSEATPLPWWGCVDSVYPAGSSVPIVRSMPPERMDFIIEAVNALPELLASVDRVQVVEREATAAIAAEARAVAQVEAERDALADRVQVLTEALERIAADGCGVAKTWASARTCAQRGDPPCCNCIAAAALNPGDHQ